MTTTTLDTTLDELSEKIHTYTELKEQREEIELELDILRVSIIKAIELTGMKEYTTDQGTVAYLTTGEITRIYVKEAKHVLSADMFKTLVHTIPVTILNIAPMESDGL